MCVGQEVMTGERLATATAVGVGVIRSNGLVKKHALTKFIVAATSISLVFWCFCFFCFFSPLCHLIRHQPLSEFRVSSLNAVFFDNTILCICNICSI